MRRLFRWGLGGIGALLLSLSLLILCVLLPVGSSQILETLMHASGVGEQFSSEQIHQNAQLIASFMRGEKKYFQWTWEQKGQYGAQSAFHMREVRDLMGKLGLAALCMGALGAWILVRTKRAHQLYLAAIALLLVMAFAAVFFEKAFVHMHHLLFANDYWMFSSDALLIQMLPEGFFLRYFLMSLVLFGGVQGVIYWMARRRYARSARS